MQHISAFYFTHLYMYKARVWSRRQSMLCPSRPPMFSREKTPVRSRNTCANIVNTVTGEESARNTWKPVLSVLDPHIVILIPLETDPPYRTHKSPLYLFLSFIFSSSFPPPPLRLRLRRRSWNDFVFFVNLHVQLRSIETHRINVKERHISLYFSFCYSVLSLHCERIQCCSA